MQFVPVAILMIAGVTGTGDKSGIEWKTHYGQAKKTAQETKRPLLIVLEDPAKPAAKFNDGKLASEAGQKALLENYLLVRVDVSTPYGQKVQEAFRADKLPYTAITDKSAKYITFRGAGSMKPSEWVAALSRHKAGEVRHATTKPSSKSDGEAASSTNYQPVYQYNSFPSFSSGST
ncbi:MAG: thioredoxin family protein [Planctomycetales bacterium]|nr:thioredoxin family protein [Planctomycetales bacterium]